MNTYKERVKKEYRELMNKVSKLSSFLSRDSVSDTVGEKQYELLTKQLTAMKSYADILAERLKDFGMDVDRVLNEHVKPVSRKRVFNEVVDMCLEEMYERSQPEDSYEALCTEYELGKFDDKVRIYEQHYLPQEEFEFIREKYKNAYGFKEHWHQDVDVLLRDLNEGGLKDGYEVDENGCGHRKAEKTPKLTELIGEENAKKVIELIEDIRDFYRFDREEYEFDLATTILTATPTSNKDTVREFWKEATGKDIEFRKEYDKNELWELDEYGYIGEEEECERVIDDDFDEDPFDDSDDE